MSTKLTVLNHGPLKVDGPFTIADGAGAVYNLEAGKSAFLCRCGQSMNKPFCDGGHKAAGFQSEVKTK
jgi:CDGSH-type Zn-finger protein